MSNSQPTYLFANWKMYLDYDESVALAHSIAANASSFPGNVVSVVFPIALALPAVEQTLSAARIQTGAQNIYWIGKGGCTGEVSAEMYKAVGAQYALVGHSERRHLFKESNHEVRQKVEAAIAAGLTPVLCVGETAKERDEGKTREILETQLRAVFSDIAWPTDLQVIVAYEPVWAIDHGEKVEPCDPVIAQEMCSLINTFVTALLPQSDPILLYGGSVRSTNVKKYLAQSAINGVLVGAASTKMDSWLPLVNEARA